MTVNYVEAFYKHMSSEGPQTIQGGLTLHALAAFYRNLEVELMSKKDEHPVHDTVDCREISGLSGTAHA